MCKTINLLKLLPVILLSACTTSYHPQDTTSAPALPHREGLVQQPDNCSVGCPQGGSHQTLYRYAYTLNNNSATKFANWVAYSVTKNQPGKRSSAKLGAGSRFTALGYIGALRL
ncbi:DNA/RNA non-specific endonuclease [Salmonella enterica subsp. arizonae]|nr:DNA/RNA non-specific endonuclease [Salmonella enterica subsp. arizonae]